MFSEDSWDYDDLYEEYGEQLIFLVRRKEHLKHFKYTKHNEEYFPSKYKPREEDNLKEFWIDRMVNNIRNYGT